jgi:hypothetical protein
MNINDIKSTPTIFTGYKSRFALCFADGRIFQTYMKLNDAKYMLTNNNICDKIHEVVCDNKGKIVADLGEINE